MENRKKTIWTVVLVVAVTFALVGLHLYVPKSKGKEAQTWAKVNPAEGKNEGPGVPAADTTKFLKENSMPALDSIEMECSKWMEEAEDFADHGYILSVKAKLKMAEWCVKDADIPEECKAVMLKNFSERAEAIMLKGYRNATSYELEHALYSAYAASEELTKDSLERFRFYSLKAGMEPDGKVKMVREILAASLAEKEKIEK